MSMIIHIPCSNADQDANPNSISAFVTSIDVFLDFNSVWLLSERGMCFLSSSMASTPGADTPSDSFGDMGTGQVPCVMTMFNKSILIVYGFDICPFMVNRQNRNVLIVS